MMQCVVIADDLTGANATGVLLTKVNLTTYTVMNEERISLENLSSCDCVVYPTDSRSVEPDIAYNRVFNVASILKSDDVKLYSKRIDSTLRGNLGSETDAILDALGDDRVAMVVPCFPASGRVLVGGYLLVNGLPLHKTEAAADPKNPIKTSKAQELFVAQSRYPVQSITMNDLTQGEAHVIARIKELHDNGVRTILFDSVTQEDIDLCADAVIASGVPFVAVDPGVFTATVARKRIVPITQQVSRRILVAVGSVNAVTRVQVEQFLLSQPVHNVYIEVGELLESEQRRSAEIRRVADEVLQAQADFEVCSIIGSGIIPERRVPFEPYMQRYGCTANALSQRINDAIAELCDIIITADNRFGGLYSCGGDITVAVCRRFEAVGLRLLSEVVPLAAFGELMGGRYDGLKIVTKGGMVGDQNALVTCVHYLKEKLYI